MDIFLKSRINSGAINHRPRFPRGLLFIVAFMLFLCSAPGCGGDEAGYAEEAARADMSPIPDGCFEMGDFFLEGEADELPVHKVCLGSFLMDARETTNAEYADCVAAGACSAPAFSSSFSRVSYYEDPAYKDFPVVYVDWYQARAYCEWRGKRLPTEAEWEYAARGGLSGGRFMNGDTVTGQEANYFDSGDPWDNDTSPAGYFPPNGYGLYDVAGNVWEWTNDWYGPDYYASSPGDDPAGPASGAAKALRGGSFGQSAMSLRAAKRYNAAPETRGSLLGIRCAAD